MSFAGNPYRRMDRSQLFETTAGRETEVAAAAPVGLIAPFPSSPSSPSVKKRQES